jgi:hypothetical protein
MDLLTGDIPTLARLFVVWPVILGIAFIGLGAFFVLFISINLVIFVVIPALLLYAWMRYTRGPNWFKGCLRWIGEQLAAVSPATGIYEQIPAAAAHTPAKPVIYSCHPHGLIAAAPYIHFSLLRGVAIVTTPLVTKLPIVRQLASSFNIIDSNKSTIDRQLASGKSMAVILGGAREAIATKPKCMRICADRRGIFELAIRHHAAIQPILTYGENEMFTVKVEWHGILGRLQNWLYKNFHGIWAFPNLLEVWRWLRGDITLQTVAAEPLIPHEGETWEELRERYKASLEELYARTRPADYAAEIEWVIRPVREDDAAHKLA